MYQHMSTVSNNAGELETASSSGGSRPFGDLRGVRWRIDLGILPSCPSASVDDFRRITADSRRRYAALRRHLLVEPHVPKDGSSSPDCVMDNPLSQSPDSMWGRYFRNAELERMVDQDLTRLSPEKSCGYFQTSRCQGLLRRILLLWSLRHPEYGYRHGMQELLAPLLYVLHVDMERLSKVRKAYDDQFADKFDNFSFHENDLSYKFDFKKFSKYVQEDNGFENNPSRASSCDPTEPDPEIQTIILLSDAYGAEGELGIVLSEKYMEHDAYSMFDSLMTGPGNGALAISDFFFSPSHSGVPPVIEASTALYHLLSNIDMSLYTHLMELGIEPQYFGLRWLRLLFEREFSLEDLLVVWDEIFSCENTGSNKRVEDTESRFDMLESPRGAFICAFGISMILHMRSSLLATENATACLQRLLNFPGDVKIVKLLSKAKSLHALALEADISIPLPIQFGSYGGRRSAVVTRCHSFYLDSTSPKTSQNVVANSYWEEKWRVLHKENEEEENKGTKQVPNRRKVWAERVRLRLPRTKSNQTSLKKKNGRSKIPRPSVRKRLLDDLARQLGSDEDNEIIEGCDQESVDHYKSTEVNDQDDDVTDDKNYENASESEVINHSPDFSDRTSSNESNSENENESERSIVTSNSFIDENDRKPCGADPEGSILLVSDLPDGISSKSIQKEVLLDKLGTGTKERKLLSTEFQWLWKFGMNSNNNYNGANEGTLENRSAPEDAKACAGENYHNKVFGAGSCDLWSKGETVDQNLMVSLKTIGQSMLENIQVIETVYQQDRGQTRSLENLTCGLVGKGQITAMAALKELRKISNLLSEM